MQLHERPLRRGVVAGALLCACGCFGGDSGPQRFDVSGTVMLDGEPAPRGEVFFAPDIKKGNAGPGAVTNVVDGKYRTAEGKGVTPGPHIVNIVAFDGIPAGDMPDGRPLTTKTYQVEVDLPAENSVQDFDVPPSHLVKRDRVRP
jgi:hypothetical protein